MHIIETLHIKINKEKEDKNWVYCSFMIRVKTGEKEDEFFGKINIMTPKFGYCSFNKHDETFELDKERSDPLFLEENNRVVLKVHAQLLKHKRYNLGYPDILDIASG